MDKQCVRCLNWFEPGEFYKQAGSKDGLDPYHKDCRKEVTRMYAVTHRKQMSKYQREYYQRNREQILQKRKDAK